jgi:hypothetical protein
MFKRVAGAAVISALIAGCSPLSAVSTAVDLGFVATAGTHGKFMIGPERTPSDDELAAFSAAQDKRCKPLWDKGYACPAVAP